MKENVGEVERSTCKLGGQNGRGNEEKAEEVEEKEKRRRRTHSGAGEKRGRGWLAGVRTEGGTGRVWMGERSWGEDCE